MNTVYIIFENGEVTTIKSKLALTIATGFINDWFDMREFKVIPTGNGEFYFINKHVRIKDIIENVLLGGEDDE